MGARRLHALEGLAFYLFKQKRYEEASRYVEQILAVLKRTQGEDAEATLEMMEKLVLVHHEAGDSARAEELDRQIQELRSRRASDTNGS